MRKITKSDILSHQQCSRLSHLNKSAPPANPDFFAEQGIYVTRQAQIFFGADTVIEERDGEKAAKLTGKALSHAQIVGEANLQSDRIGLRLDLAWQNELGLSFIEIKSSTHSPANIKKHLPDVAAQVALLSAQGIHVNNASIALLNPEAAGPNAKDLFIQTDVTSEVKEMTKTIDIARVEEDVNREAPPSQEFCKSCSKCAHFSSCFPEYPPKNATIHIPRMSYKKLAKLHENKIYSGKDVPDNMMTENQLSVVASWKAGKEIINDNALESAFQKLNSEGPVHFLDFEVVQPAIPLYGKQRPYTHLPFQFSLHTRHPGGVMHHSEFLHNNESDPTPHFIKNLIRRLGGISGPIVVYTNYEKQILESCCKRSEELLLDAETIEGIAAINERMFDLHEVVQTSLYHPEANGKTSIKAILPILVPDQSYEHLAVQNGTQAVEAWMDYRSFPTKEKAQNLLDYCKQDTIAMVHIMDELSKRREQEYER